MANDRQLLDRRLELHTKLCGILGSTHVYFQPPESMKITNYPCIIYERYGIDFIKADNIVYGRGCKYRITVVDKDPDSLIVDKLSLAFPTIKYNRHYVSDNLNHNSFIITY